MEKKKSSKIRDELEERCLRVERLIELKQSGKKSKVAEGIESEFKDMINWCVFGILISRGYGVNLKEILNDFGEDVKFEEDVEIEDDFKNNEKINNLSDSILLEELKENLLQSENPFPSAIRLDASHPIAKLKEFVHGSCIYVRGDLIDPVNAKAGLDKYGEVIFVMTSFNGSNIKKPEIEQELEQKDFDITDLMLKTSSKI